MIYLDNPYRILGFYNDAARSEAYDPPGRLELEASANDPLRLLDPLDRDPAMLRDALAMLDDREARLRHRLLWFGNSTGRDREALELLARGDFKGAVGVWGSSEEPGSRANLARLYHVLVIARDLEPREDRAVIPDEYRWRDAYSAWSEALRSEDLWRDLAAVERASGEEAPALQADIGALRAGAWEYLLEPSLLHVRRRVEEGHYGLARDHIDELRAAGVPSQSVAALLAEGFEPVVEAVAAGVNEILEELDMLSEMSVRTAYIRYREEVFPYIRDMVQLAGFKFGQTRQMCEKGAFCLQRIAMKGALHAKEFSRGVQEESNALLSGKLKEPESLTPSFLRGTDETGARKRHKWPTVLGVIIVLFFLSILNRVAGCGARERYENYLPSSLPITEYTPTVDSLHIDSLQTMVVRTDTAIEEMPRRYERTEGYIFSKEELAGRMRAIDFKLRGLERIADTLEEHRKKIDAYSDRIPSGGSADDSLQRVVLDRARLVWLKLYLEAWPRFDESYREYRASLDTLNQDIRVYNRVAVDGDRVEAQVADEAMIDLHTQYSKYKNGLEKNRSLKKGDK